MEGTEADDERVCRYCLDDEEGDDLISPCACSGGQKYVHLKCLRRWQRMVLVSQPTHPAYYQDDVRHHKCNVCLTEYTCPPPTRAELMESFTGPEIAALLMVDRIICSREVFSEALEDELAVMSPSMSDYSSYQHWVKGTYLIYSVKEDPLDMTISIPDIQSKDLLLSKLNEKLEVTLQGKTYKLVPESSLGGVKCKMTDPDCTKELSLAVKNLELPATVVLSCLTPRTSADDNISAVNLHRRIASPVKKNLFENIVDKVAMKYPRVRNIDIRHYIGGPVETDDIGICIVTGSSRGWTVVPTLERALLMSLCRRSNKKYGELQGQYGGGQIVKIVGLKSRTDLNGQLGMTARFIPTVSDNDSSPPVEGRWEVLLCSGEGVRVKPVNLQAVSHAPASLNPEDPQNNNTDDKPEDSGPGRVLVFWGVARWTRAQLLGEIARGHWGLCRATAQEFILKSSSIWSAVINSERLVYAPPSDMTDQLIRPGGQAQIQMESARRVMNLYRQVVGAEYERSQEEEEVAEMEENL